MELTPMLPLLVQFLRENNLLRTEQALFDELSKYIRLIIPNRSAAVQEQQSRNGYIDLREEDEELKG
jgi:hypothetical protein